jgi:hypothetical protein
MKPRLQIASNIFHGFMYIDLQSLFDDPMQFAQRSLLLADALIASEALSDPAGPASGSTGTDLDPCDEEFMRHAMTRAARARFDFNLDARRAAPTRSPNPPRLN